MTGILGIDPLDPQWHSAGACAEAPALDALVQTMITQRADARAAKDWAAADRIRDAIAAAGIALEDTADGTHWSVAVRGSAGSTGRSRREGELMAGKPGRPGASKGSKKGPTKGTGGKNKRSLEGRGPTPEGRGPRLAPRRQAQGRAERYAAAGGKGKPGSKAERTAPAARRRRTTTPRWSPAATRCSRRCAPRSPRRRSTSRSASRWTTASRRCCRSRRTARSR